MQSILIKELNNAFMLDTEWEEPNREYVEDQMKWASLGESTSARWPSPDDNMAYGEILGRGILVYAQEYKSDFEMCLQGGFIVESWWHHQAQTEPPGHSFTLERPLNKPDTMAYMSIMKGGSDLEVVETNAIPYHMRHIQIVQPITKSDDTERFGRHLYGQFARKVAAFIREEV